MQMVLLLVLPFTSAVNFYCFCACYISSNNRREHRYRCSRLLSIICSLFYRPIVRLSTRRSRPCVPAQYSQRPHPGRSAVGYASGVPLVTAFATTLFSGFQAAGFSSSRPQARRSFPRRFSLLVLHGAFLSAHGQKKRTAVFYAKIAVLWGKY